MSTRGMGAHAGAALEGYYRGKGMMLDDKERRQDRERELRMRSQFDPMDLERAHLTLDQLRREGKLEAFLYDTGMMEELEVLNLGRARSDTARAGYDTESARLGLDRERRGQRPALEAIDRAGERSRQEHREYMDAAPDRKRERELGMRSLERGDRLDAAREPWQVAGMTAEQEAIEANTAWHQTATQLRDALANARLTGDPSPIVSAYDNLIPDGQQVTVRKREGGRIQLVTPRIEAAHGPEGITFESFEDFLNATGQVFTQFLSSTQPLQPGLFSSGGRRGSGYGLSGPGRAPAATQIKDDLFRIMSSMEKYKDMDPADLEMLAWQVSQASKSEVPEIAAREMYENLVARIASSQGNAIHRQTLDEIATDVAKVVDQLFGNTDWRAATGASSSTERSFDLDKWLGDAE